jgi:hypothetical protein
MTIATNALVSTSTNPLVITGQTEKSFQDVIRFESEATLIAVKQVLEQNIASQLDSGTSRFSDLVEGLRTKLTILNRTLGLSF